MEFDAESIFSDMDRVSDELWKLLFFGIIFVYISSLLIQAGEYSPDARLFPILIGIVVLVLILLKIVILFVGDKYIGQFGGTFQNFSDELEGSTGGSMPANERYKREFEAIGWAFCLLLLIWLFGFYTSLVLFVATFIHLYERDIRRAILFTVVTWGVVFVLFDQLLSAPSLDPVIDLSFVPISQLTKIPFPTW